MKKTRFSLITGIFRATLITLLLSALFVNLSTFWSIREIKHGKAITQGYFCTIIGSGSMEPTLSINDLLLIKADASYRHGDIVTYLSPRGSLITHRVRRITEQGYIVQGDANNIPDEEILKQRILGKIIFSAPYVGMVLHKSLSPAGIVLFTCGFTVVLVVQKIRKEQAESESDETNSTCSKQ